MKRWIHLVIAGFLTAEVLQPAVTTCSAQVIAIGPNVQVSAQNSHRAHWEVRVAADPANAKRLLACPMVHSAELDSVHTIVYASSDGGQNWRATFESDRTPDMAD